MLIGCDEVRARALIVEDGTKDEMTQRLWRAGQRRIVTGAESDFQGKNRATGPLSEAHHRAFTHLPMPSTIPAIWWGLALLALVALALVPACEYFNRRYVAADPWKAS
jgi:hypothetical protein